MKFITGSFGATARNSSVRWASVRGEHTLTDLALTLTLTPTPTPTLTRYEHTLADAARADWLLGPAGDTTFAMYARNSFEAGASSAPPAPPSSNPSLSVYNDCNSELVSMGEANSPR